MRRTLQSLLAVLALAATTVLAGAATATASDPQTFTSTRYGIDVGLSDTVVHPGDTVTFTASVTNPGPFSLFAEYDPQPMGTTRDTLFSSVNCAATVGTHAVSCALTGGKLLAFSGPLMVGESAAATVQLKVRDDAALGSYTFKHASYLTPPSFGFTVRKPEADLAVDLKASAPLLLGSHINYTAAVTNQGPGTTGGATVVMNVPPATTGVSQLSPGCAYDATDRQVTCTTAQLAPGQTATPAFRANLGLLTLGLPLPASATVTSADATDPNPADNSDSAGCAVVTGLVILC
ncbi:hypothetical protein [Streptomyces sp. NPDC094032]|uniref:hypothetical protein n=1 Tax=Streptomyces sp. NPDC094032 TaxID=3155308 RepID=UPI0033228B96